MAPPLNILITIFLDLPMRRACGENKKIDLMAIFLYYNRIIAGSSNGRTWAFEAQYLGSSPSPAAVSLDTAAELKHQQTFNIILLNLIHKSKKRDLR